MNQEIDINELEEKVKRSVYQDGLVEIFMGVGLLYLSSFVVIRIFILFIAYIPILFVFYKVVYEKAKARYIYPRIGYARFPNEEQEGDPKAGLVVVLLLLLSIPGSFFLLTGTFGEETGWLLWSIHYMPRFFGILLSIGPLVMARVYKLKRGYLYAALVLAVAIFEPLLVPGLDPGYNAVYILLAIQFITFGITALLIGTTLFLRFIRKYPIPTDQTEDRADA